MQTTGGSDSVVDPDSVGMGWILLVCISNSLVGDASAAGPGNVLKVARAYTCFRVLIPIVLTAQGEGGRAMFPSFLCLFTQPTPFPPPCLLK